MAIRHIDRIMRRVLANIGKPVAAGLLLMGLCLGAHAAPLPAGNKPAAQAPLLFLAQRRGDPAAPISPAPNRRRGGSLLGTTPFASPTTPVFPKQSDQGTPQSAPSGSAAGSGGGEAAGESETAGPEAPVVPPYGKEILRLSELLGALHYLRTLCGADEGTQWRDEMERLIAAEPDNVVWRARLKQNFNDGYDGFERTYQACTPSAARAAGLFLDEGKILVATIRTRYAY